ncbi:MAG: 6-phospho-beta-glucosidase [Candidatus Hydrogenedentes bacterium]|jgi:6-phospho-beta-glucosidase|nr:6-phospho-beta-glucosidase [Candidatus Hydrogenedentota bacterium]
MKFTVIGGGSSYTPELLDGLFSRLDQIPVSEVWLMDQDEERLKINRDFAERMASRHGNPFRVFSTSSLDEAVTDAKYVVTQIRVGQMGARIADEKLGLKYGIVGQETTGVGGFACALRTIPRILEVAHRMEELCPNAFLINFTNPAGINTEAVLKHSKIRTVGLCNVPIGMIMDVSKHLGYDPQRVTMDYVGLNHLSWVRHFYADDQDITAAVLEKFIEHARHEWEEDDTRENMIEAIRSLNMFCNYYLQYFYSTDTVLRTLKNKTRTRGEEVVEVEDALFEKYRNPELTEKPEELGKRGGAHYSTAAFLLIDAIENNRGSRQVVCCRNNGAVPTFDDDVSVEVSAIIDSNGAKAVPQEGPEPSIRGLMQLIKAYETLTVEAAVKGCRESAYKALLFHPLMPNALGCRALLNDLLEINRPYLQGTFF